jgi:tetratricopeptide (TPR) repeat protein
MNRPGIITWLLLALLFLPFVRISVAAQQSDAEAQLIQGDRYAAEGNLIQARNAYERAIASGAALETDSVRCRLLGLWYMNAEPHDYGKAARWFESALRMNPDNETRLHLAQELSWNGQYRPAIEHYQELLRNKPADRELNRQLARVLSWSKSYSESLAVYDELQSSAPRDVELLIERARVLSWSGRYSQAVQTYSEALEYDPENRDAKLGQAQVLYWSGHSDTALNIIRGLLKQNPGDPNASFLMAALEHNRGQDASALHWLQHATPDNDTKALKNLIERDMRPVLHLRFGFENDREQPTSGVSSTYRTLRYTSTLGFKITNNIGMEVANTVTQNDTSTPVLSVLGEDSLAIQTAGRLHFSVTPWLRLSLGAGEGSTGAGEYQGATAPRRHHWLYDFRSVIRHAGLRIDLTSARNICDYTPLAVHENLLQRREGAAAGYTFGKRVRIGGEYWHGDYAGEMPYSDLEHFRTHAQGGSASLFPILYSSERWAVEAGVRYDLFQFADETAGILDPAHGFGSTGIFMPRLYQRYAGAAHFRWTPDKWLRIELDGTYGPQRVFGFPSLNPPPAEFGNTGSVGAQVTVPSGRFEPYITVISSHDARSRHPGRMFSSNILAAGLRIRF